MIVNLSELHSFLYVPCDKTRMLEKSLSLDCDAVIFDLEDAVAVDNKNIARTNLCRMRDAISNSPKPILVRVNGVDTPYIKKDLEAVLDVAVHGIILPKADFVAIQAVELLINQMAADDQEVWIIPLIETAYGLETISDVLEASGRIVAAQFGAEDFTGDLGIPRTDEGDEISYARHRFVLACRAKGMGAIDTPFTNITNIEALIRDSERARKMGMTGKTCIHPDQIVEINKAFLPSDVERLEAEKILESWESRMDKTSGTAVLNGRMIDRPIVLRAENVMRHFENDRQSVNDR